MQTEEKLYLERVSKAIENKIANDKEKLDYYLEQLKIIPDDDENKFSMAEVWVDTFTNSLISLKRHQDKPYFARIDFQDFNRKEKDKLYIGKISLLDENSDSLVIDWRTPVANLYYDSSLGNTKYKTNDGSYIEGDLSLKRVYTIENGKLLNFIDVHSTSDDDLLKPFLGVNADNKIKNIVSSIQKEQNEIIRDPLYKNIIVQGVAGSGKTTVMLHRIAFLAYNYQDLYKTNQYLVLSPNKLFTDYISAILPDLEVDKVKQITYEEIFLEYLDLKFKPTILTRNKSSEYDYVSHYKSSKKYTKLIKKFFDEYEEKLLNRDLIYKNIIVIDKETISNLYPKNSNDSLEVKIKKLMDSMYQVTQKDSFTLINKINRQIKQLDIDDPTNRRAHVDLSYEVKQLFLKGMKNLIKEHFKIFNKNIYQLYIDFVNTLEDSLRIPSLTNLNKKQFDYDDLAAMIYLKYLVTGAKQYDSYISVSIDEAQDLGYSHFLALKKIFRGAYFTIVGDLSQSIYAYRGIEHWSDINNLFTNDMKYLKKSYRNTIEIMNYANNILRYLKVDEATPVIRHGDNVNEIKYIDKCETILERINYYKKEHNSIAIICKTKEEVDLLYKQLSKKINNITKIDESTTKYDGGICILPVYLSKGLEFDCVILSDVDDNNYNKDNILDMKLLYVGITRALHNLDVLYQNKKMELYN